MDGSDDGRNRHCERAPADAHRPLGAFTDLAWFKDAKDSVEIRPGTGEVVGWKLKPEVGHYKINMRPYFQLKLLVESIREPRQVNFANVGALT